MKIVITVIMTLSLLDNLPEDCQLDTLNERDRILSYIYSFYININLDPKKKKYTKPTLRKVYKKVQPCKIFFH